MCPLPEETIFLPADEWKEKVDTVKRVWSLYETALKETVDGCSDDLEEFLYELRLALDGDSYDED